MILPTHKVCPRDLLISDRSGYQMALELLSDQVDLVTACGWTQA